ncbi:MAG: hypothetical protein R3Y58_14300 [Eubacteriales bacterium]
MTRQELEVELRVMEYTLQEADETFQQLREDYHALRAHADELEALLRYFGIDYPEFYG